MGSLGRRLLRSERGTAMITVILVLFLMTTFAIVFYSAATQSSRTSANYRSRTEILYRAQSGVNEVAHRLSLPNDASQTISAGGSQVTVNGITFNAYIGDPNDAAEDNCQGWNPNWSAKILAVSSLSGTSFSGQSWIVPTILPSTEWSEMGYTVADPSSAEVLEVTHKLDDAGQILCYTEDDDLLENTTQGYPVYLVKSVGQGDTIITSEGGAMVDTQRKILVELVRRPYDPGVGILTNGNIRINGGANLDIDAGVHSNSSQDPGAVDLIGSPAIDGTTSAVGDVDGDSPSGDEVDGADYIAIPSQDPDQYLSQADYFLDPNGVVWQDDPNDAGEPSGYAPGNGWISIYTYELKSNGSSQNETWPTAAAPWTVKVSTSYISGTTIRATEWSYSEADAFDLGTIYADGSVTISGNGAIGVTVLARGHIKVSGSPSEFTPTIGDVTMVAGTDIEMSGSGQTTTVRGLIGCQEQIDLSGNITIYGAVISEDLADNDTEVQRGPPGSYGIQVGGSVKIIAEGSLDNDGTGDYEQVSWREVDAD